MIAYLIAAGIFYAAWRLGCWVGYRAGIEHTSRLFEIAVAEETSSHVDAQRTAGREGRQ